MKLSLGRAALVLLSVLAIVLLLALLGRLERRDANRAQVRGIAVTQALLNSGLPSGYRLTGWGDCLLHGEGADPYAMEVCYDAHGRGVEAIDRHDRRHTRIWSVRYDPSLTQVRESPSQLFVAFKQMGAFPAAMRYKGHLPLAAEVRLGPNTAGDTGPVLTGQGG